jgi:GTP-binding protein EngB required for normal cell division
MSERRLSTIVRPSPSDLADVLERVLALPPSPTQEELHYSNQLQELAARLSAGRFQVALVGQFKRGKSSLLNALLGAPVLPTGVIPLTSLATFITASDAMRLVVQFEDGTRRTAQPETVDQLRGELALYVDEQHNPANAKHVERIEAFVHSTRVPPTLVFVDTPGVGSTHGHNTQAAHAALIACDAALFVVSPDPPITEVELAYLTSVRAHAAETLVVLNKSDTLVTEELATAVAFLRGVLADHGIACKVLTVSAKVAMEAQASQDPAALRGSGLVELEAAIEELAAQRGRLLDQAVAQKATGAVEQLRLANDLALAALTTPLEVLDARLAAFTRSEVAFEDERRAAEDQLAGDRRRLISALDQQAERLRERLQAGLDEELQREAADSEPQDAWDALKAKLPGELDTQFAAEIQTQRTALEAALERHQARTDSLLTELRRAAANLLEVPFRAPESTGALQMRDLPAWSQHPREALGDVPTAALVSLLPGPLRRRATLSRARRELEDLVRRNVEQLRWSTRQNLEHSLNLYQRQLDDVLRRGRAATTESIHAARERRLGDADAAAAEITDRERRRGILAQSARLLAGKCEHPETQS